ncbi:hypothetical protein EPI10_002616 [Gossypium australe]|uniref:Uncharacterized protein n=1 Tax=Gossypium australe TaxID=47621 RepID=A0A5B6VEZ2_9ROSI|nr:hypothetical protein EPI10_002616 [Gossypium australe]
MKLLGDDVILAGLNLILGIKTIPWHWILRFPETYMKDPPKKGPKIPVYDIQNQSKFNQPIKFIYIYTLYKSPNVKTGKTKSKETKAETLSHRHVRKPAWCWLKVPPPKCHLTIWWSQCPPQYLFISTISLHVLLWHHVTMPATRC